MQIVCADCGRENCNKSGAQHFYTIDDVVFKVEDDRKSVESALYDVKPEVLEHFYSQAGWNGGTIHQLVDYIMEKKKSWNTGGMR